MPLLRYFLFVGGILLALLVISDACFTKLPMPAGPVADLTTIRIHSDHKWPAPMVFDTSMPALAQMQTAQAGLPPMRALSEGSAPAPAAEPSASVRQAFAQIPAAAGRAANQTVSAAGAVRPQAKARPSRKMARKNPAPPMVLIAQRPPFGFF
jgi:hypothetical protein